MNDRTNEITTKAFRTSTGKCFDRTHENCSVTTYYVAEQFRGGDKSHSMSYSRHSAVADVNSFYSGAAPACGSKKMGYLHRGQITGTTPTCGRCVHRPKAEAKTEAPKVEAPKVEGIAILDATGKVLASKIENRKRARILARRLSATTEVRLVDGTTTTTYRNGKQEG